MSIFNINFNTKAVEWLAVNKRLPKIIGYVQALLSASQWLQNKYFVQYKSGGTYPTWVAGTYTAGTLVKYKGVVYQALTSTADIPPSPNWVVYLPSFLGVDERMKFNGNKLVLEFALNEYFQTNFRQPLLLGYYYPANTPGTPTAPDADHAQYSDIFILNYAYEIIGFNVGPRDFIPALWVANTSYVAGLSKVILSGIEYLCTTSNSDATFTSGKWSNLGAPPAGYILTSGCVTKDIAYSGYPVWSSANYTAGQAVQFDNFVFVCIKNTTNSQDTFNQTYWFLINGFGYTNPFFLYDNFTIYLPAAIYAATNDSEINNFVNRLVYAGVRFSIDSY